MKKQMFKISKQMTTETGHRLTNYGGKCAHLHGHSYRWTVTVCGMELNSMSMVADFADIKNLMGRVIEPLDHALVLNVDDPLAKLYQKAENAYAINDMGFVLNCLLATNGKPQRLIILHGNPTAEYMCQWVGEQINFLLRNEAPGFWLDTVEVWETATSKAVWVNPNCKDEAENAELKFSKV